MLRLSIDVFAGLRLRILDPLAVSLSLRNVEHSR